MEPTRVGEYVIENEIGKGSFAQVYRAHHQGPFRELVAVKSVTRAKLSPKLLENLEGEISILKSMRHTNIVDLRDCIYTDDYIHMIMEYCPGSDLSQYIRKRGNIAPWDGDAFTNPLAAAQRRKFPHPEDGGLNDTMVRSFLAQLASALRFLRSRDIVHRDIKPQNLLLKIPDEDCLESGHPKEIPQIKVADFGFARSLPAASLAKTLCGSPLYMAPEILRYEKYDAKADLWSVGAVLYEMSVGKPPFRATNHVELLRRIEHSNDRIKFPDERSPESLARDATRRRMNGEEPKPAPHEVAPDIKVLIRKLLKRHPIERVSFEEFFHDDILASVPYNGRAIIKDELAASMLSECSHTNLSQDAAGSDTLPNGNSVQPPTSFDPRSQSTHPLSSTSPNSPSMSHALRAAPAPPTLAAHPGATLPKPTSTSSKQDMFTDTDQVLASRLTDLPLNDKERTPNTAFGFELGRTSEALPGPSAFAKRTEHEKTLQPSALSRAISLNPAQPHNPNVSSRDQGGSTDAERKISVSVGEPQSVDASLSMNAQADSNLSHTLRGFAQKAYVLSEFADAKMAEYQASIQPTSGDISPAHSSPNSAAMHCQESNVAEALALYVRSLGFLQRGLSAINSYAESLHQAEPSAEMRNYANWFRTRFQVCYDRSMYARNICNSANLPENLQVVDRQIFDKALELARAAALDELEGNRDEFHWDSTSCLLAYETAASLLQGLLDPGEDHMGLSTNSIFMVEKFLKSIQKRMSALQQTSRGNLTES
ncbi:non-specific serine/threonine protein kinase [Malassezia yamatoensis]|uniref:non-specific serine/threonine protein kinase n=1 Tax=Malassezia yamatoensis TaxID=253288 RepID=A0AAJ6CGA8_9BASI|nr:non-specific serine/threonine protein kinase [Malassezia yamatoensis]